MPPTTQEKKQAGHKRSIKYIKKDFQRRFIVKFCLIALIALVVAGGLTYFLTEGTVTATYRYHRLALEKTSVAIVPALVASTAAVFVFFVLATIYVTLYVSHKIAGPLYRFEQDLQMVADGKLDKRFRLRQSDQLMDLVAQLNAVTESLEGRVADVKGRVKDLERKVRAEDTSPEDVQRKISDLSLLLDRLFVTRS